MSAPGDEQDDGALGGPSPTRRTVLEGLGVAVLAGVAGFAWFTATGPPSEDERDRGEDEQEEQEDERDDEQDDVEDQRDDEQDEQEDQRDDDQDEDRSGPDGGSG